MILCLTWDWEIPETSSLKASYSANNYTRATRISLYLSLSCSCVLYFYLELNNRMLPQSPQSSFITLAADLKLQLTYYPCNRKSHKNC